MGCSVVAGIQAVELRRRRSAHGPSVRQRIRRALEQGLPLGTAPQRGRLPRARERASGGGDPADVGGLSAEAAAEGRYGIGATSAS